MRVLASFVMQGRAQAVMGATVPAMLALVLPPIGILSSAVVALVTLRQGQAAGAVVAGAAVLACGLLGLLLLGDPFPVVGFVLVMWVPVWLLAILLRLTRSLALTAQAGLLLGVVVIVVYFLQMSDPAVQWREVLQPLSAALSEAGVVSDSQGEALMNELARWMTGLLAAGFFLQLMMALFIARWWQAMLYNPGGFREEFHGLRLHRALAVLALPLFAVPVLLPAYDWQLVRYLGMLLVVAYFLQGLAVVHGVAGKTRTHPGWLFALYLLLFLAMQYVTMVLAAVGYADAWLDFRARVRPSGET